MPNGLGAILAALAGGAGGYVESKQKQRAEALVAERLRREEENDARNEARQQRQDAIALARDKAYFLDLGATTVDPNVVSGQAQRDTQKGMAMAQDILGTQSSVPTPVADLPPATTQRGLALASAELPSKYEPQAQLSGILKDKQTALSAMDATMRNSVQLGDSRYTIPSAASKQALVDAKTRKDLIEEGRGTARSVLGADVEVSDEEAIAFAKNSNLASIRGQGMKVTKENAYIVDLAKRAKGKGPDAEQAKLELLVKAPSAHAALFPTAPRGTSASELRDNLLAVTATFRKGYVNPLTGERVVPTEDQVNQYTAGLIRDMSTFTTAAGEGYRVTEQPDIAALTKEAGKAIAKIVALKLTPEETRIRVESVNKRLRILASPSK